MWRIVRAGNAVAGFARLLGGFAQAALGAAPADEQHVAFLGPEHFWQWQFATERL